MTENEETQEEPKEEPKEEETKEEGILTEMDKSFKKHLTFDME